MISLFSFDLGKSLLLTLSLFCFSLIPAYAQNLVFEQKNGGWLLKENDNPRYFYQTATLSHEGQYPRANYIHPLYGSDGQIITEDFPDDHLHHRGIFWTWHQLWVDGKRVADPWICEGIEWHVTAVDTEVLSSSSARLSAKILWRENTGENRDIIEENLEIKYERVSPEIFKMIFDITLKPLMANVAIGGSEDSKGYGGFSPRIKLSESVGFFDRNGKVVPQELAVEAGPWINVTKNGEMDAGVVMMGEPDKLPSYQGWILRKKNSMQNMAFPGREPVLLPMKSSPLRFRNLIMVHQGLSDEDINDHYTDFVK